MNDNILVSIILPVYNVEKYLKICLDSVLTQSHRHLEIILVDDGSKDKSGIICDEYAQKDKRIKVIHKHNEGVSTARNVGMAIATGKYICFSDADDYLMPDYVEYLLDMAEEKKVDISLTTSMLSTFTTVTFSGINNIDDNIKIISGEDATIKILYYHIPIGCYCKLFNRKFLEEHNIKFFPDVFVGEGFNFNALAFQHSAKVAIGHRKIYCYRRDNPASCMTSFNIKKSEMAIKAINILQDNIIKPNSKLKTACNFALWHTIGDMYNWMILAGVQKQYNATYEKYYKIIRKGAWHAMFSPINKKERFRAFTQFIHPRLLATLLEIRRWRDRKSHKL